MRTKDNNCSESPFFTVIIAVYNRPQLIKRALDSLLKQSETDWEAVIVDDGSSDSTCLNILPYLEQYKKIRYCYQAHRGGTAAKNRGLEMASGRFVTFLDSDDEYAPDHLRSRKRILLENPAIMFLYGGVRIIGNKYVPDKHDPTRKVHLDECRIGATFFIERITATRLSGFRNLVPGSDSDLFDRAVEGKIPVMEVKKPTYIYHHEIMDSVTNRLMAERYLL